MLNFVRYAKRLSAPYPELPQHQLVYNTPIPCIPEPILPDPLNANGIFGFLNNFRKAGKP